MASSANRTRSVYLDACVFLAVFLDESTRDVAQASITAAEQGIVLGHISALVVAEVIGAPNLRAPQGGFSDEALKRIDTARDYFLQTNFRFVDLTRRVGTKAMQFALDYHLKGPDAIHLASAAMSGCDELHTNDKRLLAVGEKVPGLRVCRPYGAPQAALDLAAPD